MGILVAPSARISRSSWSVAVVAAMLLGLVLAGPALAADPPADVVLDGVVTVTFVDAGSGNEPLPDATVTIEASRPADADPTPFQTLTGTTAGDGSIVLTGVARAADGAAPVTLTISATLARDNDCGGVETIDGSTTVEASANIGIAVVGHASSSCAAFPILGLVLDTDDQPFPVEDAAATITYPGADPETVDVDVAEDGSFGIVLRAWSGDGSTEVHLTVLGAPQETPGAPDCIDTIAQVADVTWTLEAPVAPEPSIVTAQPVVLGSVCAGAGTPGPAAPTVTLPPTDTTTATSGYPGGGSPAALVVLGLIGLVALVAGLAAPARRVSRRGS